ncbi:MAG: biotin transporter BioY [Oscillochloris sp.]|nr:biotin transporter BioY [Oscillochloris sp.]
MEYGSASAGTLAQQLLPRRGMLSDQRVADLALVLGGSLFVALCAQIRIPLPFSPVPITGQTLGVLLVGSLLGPRLGLLAMLLYLVQGAIGLPFFAGGEAGWQRFAGATGGYLVAFPIAAALSGWLATRGWDRKFGSSILAMALSMGLIYLVGAAWLSTFIGVEAAIANGVLPFLLVDALKIALAGAALPGGWKLVRRLRDNA